MAGIPPRRRLLVAVSGGADSTALLHLLLEAGYRNLVVAHFNHRLRGRASAADAAWVARLASRLGLPCESGEGEVRRLAAEGRRSVETAAREARYGFLARTARTHRARTVVLGHHADDQVETCLFHFLRGSGLAGLSGMKPRSVRRLGGTELALLRPLLPARKADLLDYLKARRIRFREDASNALPGPSRNTLRLDLLPRIGELFGESFRGAVARNARLLADEEEFLAGLADPMAARETLPVPLLRGLHPALRRRVLHSWLKRRGVEEPGFAEVERVASLLDPAGPAKVNLPADRHARRRAGILFVEG
jgi:tRNA(Ile)-lysidine synthase